MGANLKREVMDLKERKTKMKRERMLKISPISVEKDIDERNNRGFGFSQGKRSTQDGQHSMCMVNSYE